MKRIIKGDPPDFWTFFCRKHEDITYTQISDVKDGFTIRSKLHDYLSKEQGNICCYCCCKLEEKKSHNEHIKPKGGKYNYLSMDYNNIVVSCTNNQNCGRHKDPSFIDMLEYFYGKGYFDYDSLITDK